MDESPPLRWLYFDLNSYFASVEQQLQPELRGDGVVVGRVELLGRDVAADRFEAAEFVVGAGLQRRRLVDLGLELVLLDLADGLGVEFVAALEAGEYSNRMFVPIRFPYPTKTRPFRPLTLACGAIWGVMMLALLAWLPEPPLWIAWSSLVFVGYYLLLTTWLWWRRRPA